MIVLSSLLSQVHIIHEISNAPNYPKIGLSLPILFIYILSLCYRIQSYCFKYIYILFWDFPGSPVVKTPCSHSRRHRFVPWLGLTPGLETKICMQHDATKKQTNKQKKPSSKYFSSAQVLYNQLT